MSARSCEEKGNVGKMRKTHPARARCLNHPLLRFGNRAANFSGRAVDGPELADLVSSIRRRNRPRRLILASQLEQGTVFIIEDDNDVRESLRGLFRSVGLGVQAFASVQEYLAGAEPDRPGCMVLDVRLPGRNGLDFHEELVRSGSHIPVVFISGHADVPMSVRAMKAGAVEFLTKPVRDQDLLDAVQSAVRRDLDRRESVRSSAKIRAKFDTLTPREREIMAQLVLGRRNKQIADEMRLSEATVKLNRAHVMQKMAAPSLADLIWMGDALGLPRPKPHT